MIKSFLASNLLAGRVLYRIREPETVYLTFDDGPNARHTPDVLSVLDEHDVKATFFMVGRDVRLNPRVAADVANRGHVLANHTLTHPRMDRLSRSARQLEIEGMDDVIESVGGQRAQGLFRPPYGHASVSLIGQCLSLKRTVVMWSRDSFDYRASEDEVVAGFEKREVVAGDILLFHDDSPASAPALRRLIPRWKRAGLRFATLSGHLDKAAA
jgi:peptidoglycan-N-acetylglucosamine deacetylase